MIRIHKDTTTPAAIADSIKLTVGDVFERRDDIPGQVTFQMLVENNSDFKEWIVDIIQMSLFTSSIRDTPKEFEPFKEEDYQSFEVSDAFCNDVFAILNNVTKEDFVQYRLDLIAESKKENPNFVEIG